jgi:pimeloyl-ACP methyl ester carboxylesterase
VFLTALLLSAAMAKAADGVPIHFTVEGRGEPAIVFVHCWNCDRRFWDAQMAEFGKTHRVVAIDLPGHGESGNGRKEWTVEAFGNDVKTVVDRVGAKRVVLVGSSMGGPIVLEAARRLPDRVAGIVPVDSLVDFDFRMKPEQIEGAMAAMRRDYKVESTKFITENLFAPSTPPAVRDRVLRLATSARAEPSLAILRAVWAYDPLPALAEIHAPIRAINGEKYPTNLEGNRRHYRDFDAAIMKGTGHYLMIEDPKRFNALLADALRQMR